MVHTTYPSEGYIHLGTKYHTECLCSSEDAQIESGTLIFFFGWNESQTN